MTSALKNKATLTQMNPSQASGSRRKRKARSRRNLTEQIRVEKSERDSKLTRQESNESKWKEVIRSDQGDPFSSTENIGVIVEEECCRNGDDGNGCSCFEDIDLSKTYDRVP